ncbi:D-alanyl-D-alanine carboxypeptidase family protein [Parafrankia discariae]|uniref:D-alanyl-D-alanine carboxypeptidase family protein n=1 Tax=Parafrankia discariae TaxID=365528 RepID=UPI001E49EA11|nr:D-alanyl-D-alanine carboxypeptidase family protein [Parafrankia discariae]
MSAAVGLVSALVLVLGSAPPSAAMAGAEPLPARRPPVRPLTAGTLPAGALAIQPLTAPSAADAEPAAEAEPANGAAPGNDTAPHGTAGGASAAAPSRAGSAATAGAIGSGDTAETTRTTAAAGTPAAVGAAGVVGAAVPPPAGITAEAWLVADAGSGAILAAHNAHLPDLPASTMKMLTALTVLPGLPPDREVTISDQAAQVDGTRVGLVPGVRYTVRDLATAMLIASGNDATVALVEAAGGREAVLDRMNRLAASLGATETVAGDPTGLDAPGQHTTAHDLAVIGRAVLDNPIVRGYLTIPRASLPGRGDERFEIANHNTLLGNYEGTIGIKNGYTVAAGATFVGAATRNGRTLIVSLLRTAPVYATDARALLDWGFAHAADVRPVGRLAGPLDATPGGLTTGDGTAAAPGSAAGGDSSGTGDSGDGDGDGRTDSRDARRDGDNPLGRAAAGDTGGGVGVITWTALAVTVVATALTVFGRVRRRLGVTGRPTGRTTRPGSGGAGRRDGAARRDKASRRDGASPGEFGGQRGRAAAPGRIPGGGSHRRGTSRTRRDGAAARARARVSAADRPHTGADGQRHLVGLPSLHPEPQRGRTDSSHTDTPPFGTARSPRP